MIRSFAVMLAVGLFAVVLPAQPPHFVTTIQESGNSPSATTNSPPTYRLVWQNAEGLARFVDQGEGYWAEVDQNGEVFLPFQEVRRNCDFVELYDRSRGYTLRLYDDALLILGGHEGFSTFPDFTAYYVGRWVK
jgi:hypothetical protein